MSDDKEVVAWWYEVQVGDKLFPMSSVYEQEARQQSLMRRVDPLVPQSLLLKARAQIAELQLELGRTKPMDAADPDYPNAQGVAETLRNCQEDLLTEARFVLWQERQIAERDARIKELEQDVAMCEGRYEHWFKEATKARGDLAAARTQQVPEGWQLQEDVVVKQPGELGRQRLVQRGTTIAILEPVTPQPDSSYANLPISHPYYTPDRDE